MSDNRKAMTIIFSIVFLDLMGFGIVIPLLPLYAEAYAPKPIEFGLLFAAYSSMQLLFSPLLGRWSDRIGRRPILILSLFGSVIGYILFGLARSLAVLFASRIVDGISGANIGTAQAYVADITPPDRRARGMGMIGAAFGLGFILGPAIGGFAVKLGESWPGFIAAGLSGLACLATVLFLPEPRHTEAGDRVARRVELGALREAFRRRQTAVFLVTVFVATFAFSNFETTFSQFLHDIHGLSPHQVSLAFVYIGILMAIVQGGLLGSLVRRFGERTLAVFGGALLASGFVLLPLPASIKTVFLALVPVSVGVGLVNPSLSSLLSRSTPGDEQGGTLGLSQSMSSLGRIIGPICGQLAYGATGARGPEWIAAACTVLAIGGVVMAGPVEDRKTGDAISEIGSPPATARSSGSLPNS
jgi:multidrug resistance protein